MVLSWRSGLSAMLLAAVSGSAASTRLSAEALRLLDPSRQMLALCGAHRDHGRSLRAELRYAASLAPIQPGAGETPKLYPGLGTVGFPISTKVPMVQRWFDQGLALNYNFNHGEGIRAFREAQRLDPDCAMCAWGEALSHGPNINAPMDPESVAATMKAIDRAVALKRHATPLEGALIDALTKRYAADPKADRTGLDAAYSDAMAKVADRYPDDDTVAVLAAEADMDTQAWDYWAADRRTPKGRTAHAMALVEKVLARNPEQVQAEHLYIHLTEASIFADKAAPFADKLAGNAPNAGHLVHMPGHTYYVLGRFADSIARNVDAVRVDEAYLKDNPGAPPGYRFGYYPHNVHFIVTSAQMAGDLPLAIDAARKLRTVLSPESDIGSAVAQAVDAAPYFAFAQGATPAQILALPAPDKRLTYATAMYHYARAVGHALDRDAAGVALEVSAIRTIREKSDLGWMIKQGVPGPDLLRLAELSATARLAFAQGHYAEAARGYREAVKIEATIPYQEPPYWYYPTAQSLGAALYKSGDYDGARQAFLDALAQYPNNGWALYGLAQTQRALGDAKSAQVSEAALSHAWIGNPKWLRMDRL